MLWLGVRPLSCVLCANVWTQSVLVNTLFIFVLFYYCTLLYKFKPAAKQNILPVYTCIEPFPIYIEGLFLNRKNLVLRCMYICSSILFYCVNRILYFVRLYLTFAAYLKLVAKFWKCVHIGR